MQESLNLLQIQNRGSVLFIYSDKLKVYVIYDDLEENALYRFVCNKQLIIETVHPIDVPDNFMKYDDLQWHRPTMSAHNDIVYPGMVTIGDKSYLFKIDEQDSLTISDQPVTSNVFSLLPMDSLKHVEVEAHIQKSNLLFAIGYNRDTLKQVFLLIDIAEDKVVREYTISSALGEIVANTINIDRSEGRIYIGGRVRDGTTHKTLRPFFESFLMPVV